MRWCWETRRGGWGGDVPSRCFSVSRKRTKEPHHLTPSSSSRKPFRNAQYPNGIPQEGGVKFASTLKGFSGQQRGAELVSQECLLGPAPKSRNQVFPCCLRHLARCWEYSEDSYMLVTGNKLLGWLWRRLQCDSSHYACRQKL